MSLNEKAHCKQSFIFFLELKGEKRNLADLFARQNLITVLPPKRVSNLPHLFATFHFPNTPLDQALMSPPVHFLL